MGTFVIFHQVASLSLDTNLPHPLVNPARTISSIYDSICPPDQALLLPLWASASLPTFAADVAELSFAQAS
jgi:hypothetical protein